MLKQDMPGIDRKKALTIACFFILQSLILHLVFNYSDYTNKLSLNSWDAADYRYVAEKFWGVDHNPKSYVRFSEAWMHYLDAIPLRSIVPGSYYLLLSGLVPIKSHYIFTLVYAVSMQLLLIGSYLFFFIACQKRYGLTTALYCLLLITLPIFDSGWGLTRTHFLGDVFLRAFFMLLLAMIITYEHISKNYSKQILIFAIILVLCAHTKAQWTAFGTGMAMAFVLLHVWMKSPWSVVRTWLAVAVAVPMSVLMVNYFVWDHPTLSPGISAHINNKTRGGFIDYVCEKQDIETIVFCTQANRALDHMWWKIYMGNDVSPEEFRALDKNVVPFLMERPKMITNGLSQGLYQATSYPHMPRVFKLLDYAIWAILLAGLAYQQTFLFSSFGLGMWLVPAISNIFSSYDPRYHELMESIPMVLAILILAHILPLWGQKIKRAKYG